MTNCIDLVAQFLKEATLGPDNLPDFESEYQWFHKYSVSSFYYGGDEAEPWFDTKEFKKQFKEWLDEKCIGIYGSRFDEK